MSVEQLITDNIDIWTSAIKTKSASGRGNSNKLELHGIKKLRELILELAFSGKLLNDSSEEDFEAVLSDFKKQREMFHKVKGVRIQAFKRLHDEYKLPGIPSNWKECFLDEVITYITDFQANGSFSTLKSNVKYYDTKNYALLVRLTDLRHGLTNDSNYKYTDEHGYNFLNKSSVHGGELVVANVGAGVGTTLLVPELNMPATLAPNMFMVVLPETIDKDYFLYFSQSPQYWAYLNSVNTGTGQPKINKTEYKNCKFPLAPLKMQRKIVSKIKELMALCDQLESQTEASIEAHQLLVKTLLETLTNAKDADDLNDSWQRISEHFDVLFTTEYSIEQLKQTILLLAVMGKLVKQDPNEEPASKLLERIEAEKEQLIKDKKIKKQKPLPPISEDEKPFDLPDGWEWCRLQDVAYVFAGNSFKSQDFSEGEGAKVIKITNAGVNQLIETNDCLPFDFLKEYPNYIVHEGDLIIALTRPYISSGLKVSECPASYHNSLLNQRVAAIRILTGTRFTFKFLKSQFVLKLYQKRFSGSGLQPNLKMNDLTELVVPIPPKHEQKRIVAKVDELIEFCDALSTKLQALQEIQLNVSDSIVKQAS